MVSPSDLTLVLGTMTFGKQVDQEGAKAMLKLFAAKGASDDGTVYIDTAHLYQEGRTEKMLGALKDELPDTVHMATKVNPWKGNRLNSQSINKQFGECLDRMQRDSVDLLYLHAMCKKTDIKETLRAVNKLHQQKKIKAFGLSNYPAWLVVRICELCAQNNWIKPTVYQGIYNMLTRGAESELFPALRTYGLQFFAYNPLAGGLLTGKYTDVETTPTEGRFALRTHYQGRFWHPSYFKAVECIDTARKEHQKETGEEISLVDISFRWMTHHSKMKSKHGDAIILGASKLSHLEDNMSSCIGREPLPKALVRAINEAWQICKSDCPAYFH